MPFKHHIKENDQNTTPRKKGKLSQKRLEVLSASNLDSKFETFEDSALDIYDSRMKSKQEQLLLWVFCLLFIIFLLFLLIYIIRLIVIMNVKKRPLKK